MAFTTIDDPSKFFQTTLYTGNGGTQAIANNGNSDLQPDWVWIKERPNADDHKSYDSSRGTTKKISQNDGSAEENQSGVTAFSSDGFSLGSHAGSNQNSTTYVAWQWKCNGGTSNASASESGSNVAYNFQVNTTSKFMINIYTGTGSSATLNLGNQFTPQFMLFKNRSQADDWVVYHHKNTANPHTDHLHLNTNAATADDEQMFGDVVFAADEINLGTNHDVNADGENYVAYAFAGVQGYSKFDTYKGNGNANGPFVYTGFKPAWLLIKRTSSTGDWLLWDNQRDTGNVTDGVLKPNSNAAENTGYWYIDFLSNGFKIRATDGEINQSNGTFIYMAFAEHPLVSSDGTPTTAR